HGPRRRRHLRRRQRLGLLHDRGAGAVRRVAATLVAFGALAAPAQAAETSGSLTLTVTKRTDRALDARGVKVQATGKASRSGRRVTLPISAGDTKALRTSGS